MSKKIILALAAFTLIFTSGCEEKTTPDPQELLREAFENAFEINSAAFSANGNIKIQDVENTNSEVKLTFEGKGENLLEFPPKIDYSIEVEFSAQNPEEGNVNGSGEFSIKMLDDLIFAKYELLELAGNSEIEAAKPFIQMFSGKWYKFSLETLAGANPEFEAVFAQQRESQQKFIEFYKKLMRENDILLAKNLKEDGKDFVIEVKPNFDLIFSENFLDKTFNDFLELIKEIDESAPNPPEFDDEMHAKLPEIRETVKKVWEAGNFKITMKIGKENRIAHTSIVHGNLDLAELAKIIPEEQREEIEMAEEISGKIIFDFISESRDFNQPQNIIPPEDFIDFDPAMIFGVMSSSFPAPAEFESTDLLQEIPLSRIGEFAPPILEEEDPIMENQPVSRPR